MLISDSQFDIFPRNSTANQVVSYADIEAATARGTRNRTTGKTNMNATSSRAHTVVGISFTKIERLEGLEAKTSAQMKLVRPEYVLLPSHTRACSFCVDDSNQSVLGGFGGK
jgi:hypothetical protein